MILVIEKTAAVLDVVAELGAVTHGLIARRTGLNKATLSNILKTLVSVGYVEKTDAGLFKLGRALRELARKRAWSDTLAALADAWAGALAEQTGELISIAAMRNGHRIRLAKAAVDRSITVNTAADASPSPYATATGRALLAYLATKELGRVVAEFGLPADWPEARTKTSLRKTLAAIRRAGLAVRCSEDAQVEQVAVPVLSEDGEALAAIGAAAPVYRFTGRRRRRALKAMKDAAERMARELAGHGVPKSNSRRALKNQKD